MRYLIKRPRYGVEPFFYETFLYYHASQRPNENKTNTIFVALPFKRNYSQEKQRGEQFISRPFPGRERLFYLRANSL